jgi:3,4-dihydroxy 2-butanone 4-phosphate synthase/GTP cyclohydrolase II
LVTIADLKAWRRAIGDLPKPDSLSIKALPRVRRSNQAHLPTAHGDFTVIGYRDQRSGASHLALQPTQAPSLTGTPLVRVHSECLTGDALGSERCDCGAQLAAALRLTAKHGGAVIYLRGQEGRGIGLLAKLDAYALQDRGRDTVDANLELGWPIDRREYGAAAAILEDLGLKQIRLLTNNPAKAAGLAAGGITVENIEPLVVGVGEHNRDYLATKAARMGHQLGQKGAEQ